MAITRKSTMDPQSEMDVIVGLFGGVHAFSRPVRSSMDAHEVILKGFSNKALTHLVGQVAVMQQPDVMEKALGISHRTFLRRQKVSATKPLSPEQSGRAWKFAEFFSKAIRILGISG